MNLISANINNLRTLYIRNLKRTLDMEQKIAKALPNLIQKSTDSELSNTLRAHLEETKDHASKIEKV